MSVQHERPMVPAAAQGPTTYYNYPPLKPPGWGWLVALYFFVGGIASGSYVAATLVDVFGTHEDRSVGRVGRYLAFLTVLICPVLLVVDLGRPERFTNMLRILKSRSPMSMGSWGLSFFGAFAGLGAVRQAAEDGLIPRESLLAQALAWVPSSFSGLLGTAAAFFVGSYTGVLVSFTNVPVWARAHLLQGPLFLTSALSTGLSAISLVLTTSRHTPGPVHDWLNRSEIATSLGELMIVIGSLISLRSLAGPLTTGRNGVMFWGGGIGIGMALPLALRLSAQKAGEESKERRVLDALASAATLVGGLALRAATVFAGRPSAESPREYLEYTRAR